MYFESPNQAKIKTSLKQPKGILKHFGFITNDVYSFKYSVTLDIYR